MGPKKEPCITWGPISPTGRALLRGVHSSEYGPLKNMAEHKGRIMNSEPIEMPFGGQRRVGPRNHMSNWGAQWRHVANTMDQFARQRRCGLSLPLVLQLVSIREGTSPTASDSFAYRGVGVPFIPDK